MKIQLTDNDLIVDMEGAPILDGDSKSGEFITKRKMIARLLGSSQTNDPVRAFDLGIRLLHSDTEPVDLNDSDVAFIKELIKNHQGYIAAVKAQCMKVFDK